MNIVLDKKVGKRIIAVEQPYFLPYIGYWQLLNVVDTFVLLDDVNFIKRGFINRNSILLNDKSYRFSIPVRNASQNRLIKDTKLCFDNHERNRFLSRIKHSYVKAPFFANVYSLLEKIMQNSEDDLTDFIKYSICVINEYLKIDTSIVKSSEINKNNFLTGQDRIIEICQRLNSNAYINPEGGRQIYDRIEFESKGIDLFFLNVKHNCIKYKQFNDRFIGMLSIIDIMMFNPVKRIQYFLKEFELNE